MTISVIRTICGAAALTLRATPNQQLSRGATTQSGRTWPFTHRIRETDPMTYLRALVGAALVTTSLLGLHGTASARP